jgi:myosin heavy subunit
MVKGDSEVVSNTEAQAEDVRDALARGIYSRLVDWLINALNLNLCLGRKVL